MNIVFYILLAVVVIFLWFTLAFIFKPLGGFFVRLWEDAKKEMYSDEKEN